MYTGRVSADMTLDQLMISTIERQATDVHILVQPTHACVKWRCHGRLSEEQLLPNGEILVNRIKILSELNIAETRRVQEGMFDYEHLNQRYSIRVSIVRSDKGEKLALRVLHSSISVLIDELGLGNLALSALKESIHLSNGLILVCGATGSGKTTTLYSCLQEINDGSRSIFTIEDPVEMPTDGIYQFEPNPALDISTHDLLKAFMRQDPDVIMVGEIRDAKTADLAISAALTGHLVLATLHTNNPLNVVQRCKNWQVDYFALASSLRLIIHQSMQYTNENPQPKFTTIRPNWDKKLPSDYNDLIEQPSLWMYLDEDLI